MTTELPALSSRHHVGRITRLAWPLLIGQLADRIGYPPLFGMLSVFDILGAVVLIAGLRHLRLPESAK